jgi:hypothetical protein
LVGGVGSHREDRVRDGAGPGGAGLARGPSIEHLELCSDEPGLMQPGYAQDGMTADVGEATPDVDPATGRDAFYADAIQRLERRGWHTIRIDTTRMSVDAVASDHVATRITPDTHLEGIPRRTR